MCPSSPAEERVVVLAPSAHDGPVTAGVLARQGFECVLARDVGELCEEVAAGAAAVLLTEEALTGTADVQRLGDLLAAQEPWSDLPVLLLTARADAANQPVQRLAPLGNVTMLDRPLSVASLASWVHSALRARRRQYAARAVLQELQVVLDSVPCAIFVTHDRDARTVTGNRFAAEVLRLAPGANTSLSAPPDERPGTFRVLRDGREVAPADLPIQQAAARGVEIRESGLEVAYEDGSVRHIFGNAAPLPAASGGARGAVGAFLDVTALRKAEEELRLADQRKDEFLAVLSHELRNPLAPIRNGVQLLLRAPPGSDVAARAVEIIRRQSEQLTRLVDDLLDVTRIARGKIELRLAPLDAREVVARAVEDARHGFEHRVVALGCAGAVEPIWIHADEARLTQMIGNLLHNALKFTPPGGRVEVNLQRTASGAEIAVRDTGAGIAAAELDRIFEPFVQAERTRGQRQGGLGIGLALVRALAQKHGGSVLAHSDGPDRGATFVLTLPLAEAPRRAPGIRAPAEAPGPLSIVIVEDNEDAGLTLRDLLALGGHDVTLTTTGQAGIAQVLALSPDLLLCDLGLPDMSGHEVIRAIRSSAAGGRLFAAAFSGYAQLRDKEAARDAGFDAHLAKPAELSELNAVLAEVADRKYLRRVGPDDPSRVTGGSR